MIKLKTLVTENLTKRKYSGVSLDSESHNKLKTHFSDKIPEGWEIIAHHMTINPFGPTPEELLNKNVTLKVTEVGKSDKALAVKVSGYEGKTNNKFPHITIAIDRNGGAKPKDSNDIVHWEPVRDDIYLKGTIKDL